MNLQEAILDAAKRLAQSPHPERARRDAELLLLHVTGRSRVDLMTRSKDALTEVELEQYLAFVERRSKGEPVQYILGETEFFALPFRVTPAVLIPRPETEHLVEYVLRALADRKKPRIVDIGTGSGAIAVSLAHSIKDAKLTAVDISVDALAVARSNASLNGVSERMRFLLGDLLAPVAGEEFDAVVSNPPYIPVDDSPTLAVEVREHEPSLALFAGEDGLDIYRRLLPAAYVVLVHGGVIALEIGYGQRDALDALLSDAGFTAIEFVPDLQGIPRVACARKL